MVQEATISLADGTPCRTWLFRPANGGPAPGVIFYMDGLGIRPTLFTMAQRLADSGHVVLLPDMFCRFGPYEPLVPSQVFSDMTKSPVARMMAATSNRQGGEDSAAFIAYLDASPGVSGDWIGTVGFCMGGAMAITAAGLYPDRVSAAASFHGGSLATDATDSPHRLANQLKAELYIGVADKDIYYPEEMAQRFQAALDGAGVTYRAELYAGATHGWMMPDFAVYDATAAERGWREMLALLGRRLPRPLQ